MSRIGFDQEAVAYDRTFDRRRFGKRYAPFANDCACAGDPGRHTGAKRRRSKLIELVDSAPHLFTALTPDRLAGEAKRLVETVEQADLLVIGTPVYRASYTGALKHLFDLVHHEAFVGKPVILTATGGSHLHGLVTEHQLRPLFGFLNALTLPTTVYAVETDFLDYRVSSKKILDRAERAVGEALTQLGRRRADSGERPGRRAASV